MSRQFRRTVTDVHVADVQKRRQPTKHYVYVLNVKWSEGTEFSVYRSYSMFFEFQAKLNEMFPSQVPSLSGRFLFGRSEVVAEKRKTGILEFCKTLISLPAHISHHGEVLTFFEAWPEDLMLKINFDSALKTNPYYSSVDQLRQKDEVDSPELYRAVASYRARTRSEVSFHSGQEIHVVEKNVNGWWLVVCGDQEGRAPASYLEPLNHRPEEDRVMEDPMMGRDRTLYVVNTPYYGQGGDELALEKGTKVDVVQQNLDGWWKLRVDGHEGFFPSTFLKKMSLHRSKDGVAEEAIYGVFLPPPPRRNKIENVDSIYSSISECQAALGEVGKRRSASASEQVTSPLRLTRQETADDMFDYCDPGTIPREEGPEYAEIEFNPAVIAQQREKIAEGIGHLQLKESESPPTQRPSHRPKRLLRTNTNQQLSPDVEPSSVERKQEHFFSQTSSGSLEGNHPEPDHDLYVVVSDYTPEDESSLTLRKGDVVEVDDIEDDWAYVRIPGPGLPKEGWAPAAFLRQKRKPKPNRPAPTLPGNKSTANNKDGSDLDEELESSGPTIVRQMVPVVRTVSGPRVVEQVSSKKADDDFIHIETNPDKGPDVYVNTREYINVKDEVKRAARTSTGGNAVHPYINTSSQQDVYWSSNPEYVNTAPRTDSNHSRGAYTSARAPAPLPSHHAGTPAPLPSHHAGAPGSLPSHHGGTPAPLPSHHAGTPAPLPSHHAGTPGQLPTHHAGTPGASVALSFSDLDGVAEVGATYRAVCDCSTLEPSCLSFCQGDLAVLNEVHDQGWWKVTCNGKSGWVPASYWQKEVIMSTGRSLGHIRSHSASDLRNLSAPQPLLQSSSSGTNLLNPHDLPTPSGRSSPLLHRTTSSTTTNAAALHQVQKSLANQVWFQGKISRKEAEECMLRDGNPCDFLVRESTHRVGDYALTVIYGGRVRHFPIEVTADGKVHIGKNKFESMPKIIQHYRDCPLFIQDDRHISLGHPYAMKRRR